MGRVIQTPRALADLDDIWMHIALDNPAAADRLIDKIGGRNGKLAEHPRLGPARPEIAPNARMLVIGDYLVLYRVNANDVNIVRVIHGARQLAGLFDIGPES